MSGKGDTGHAEKEILALQEMITSLQAQLEDEPDEAERKELQEEIKEYEDKVTLLKSKEDPAEEHQRKSTRPKLPSLKVRENLEQEKERNEILLKSYEQWKATMKASRSKLLDTCTEEDIEEVVSYVNKARREVHSAYAVLRQWHTPDPEVLRKVDRVSELSQQMLKVATSKDTNATGDTGDKGKMRQHIDMLLSRDENKSIFGGSSYSHQSRLSHLSSKRTQAAAELAKQKADFEALQEASVVKAKHAQQEAEAKLAREAQERELKMIEARRKLKIAEVELRMCDDEDEVVALDYTGDIHSEPGNLHLSSPRATNPQLTAPKINTLPNVQGAVMQPPVSQATTNLQHGTANQLPSRQTATNLNASAPAFHYLPSSQGPPTEATNFTSALADAINLHRLPTPEPTVFAGDPLHFTEWKMSFQALIDRKNIAAGDKIYYLKRYLGGAALKAVQGFFFINTVEAYDAAWKLLEERYGNPFLVKEAYRKKLEMWPRINPKKPIELREFADFLQSCDAVMPFIRGLQVLDDCAENRKLLNKLPNWITIRWNRIVSETLDSTGYYPNFKQFAQFLAKEAHIACNPVSSPFYLNDQEGRKSNRDPKHKEPKRDAGSAFNMGTTEDDAGTVKADKVKTLCKFCDKDHSLAACTSFGAKDMEKKRAFIKENKLCFGCLRVGHFSKSCKGRHVCGKCKKRHPTCLHEEKPDPKEKQPDPKEKQQSAKEEETTKKSLSTRSYGTRSNCPSTAMIVPVWVASSKDPSKEILTYALLDTQSDTSFIQQDLAEALGVHGELVKLKLTTMTSSNMVIPCERLRDLQIRGIKSQEKVGIPLAYTKDSIPIDRSAIPTRETAQAWPHLAPIANDMSPLQDCEIGMLVGYNCPTAITARKSIIGQESEPCALETAVGWSIVGPGVSEENATGFTHRVSVKETPAITPNDVLNVLEKDFNENKNTMGHSQNDLKFLEILENGIHVTERGHFQMPLPFKTPHPKLPYNKAQATTRLCHLRKKFLRDESYKRDYLDFMNGIITRSEAEMVTNQGGEGETWFIPHHGVYHPRKPGKIRVVFDCSAKYKGFSLNDHLLTGPDLTNGLFGVLCRFRQYPIAIMCDIEKMFHQFYVEEKDRDYLRFLWWKDGDPRKEIVEYRMKVHLFGAASSPGCANYALKHLAKIHETSFPEASHFIMRDFYVDDGLTSVETSEQGIHLVQTSQELCSNGGIRLHKFVSNDRAIMESVQSIERATEMKDIDLDKDILPTECALGIKWCIETDMFKFHATPKEHRHTRRGILSAVSSIFDPLGLLSPFILKGKRILQEICQAGIGWDDPLPEELVPRWEKWISDICELQAISVARSFIPKDFGKVEKTEIHHFSDASTTGYGQCSYLRIVGGDKVHCTLIASKARVAPTKVTTIPRLELTAAVVSVKMSLLLREELEYRVDDEVFWTDSKVVLGYINNDARRFHVFVANRVQNIRESTDPRQWLYIETEQNPADHASRGRSATELLRSNWFTGPQFLWEKEIKFENNSAPELLVGDPEVRSGNVFVSKSAESSVLLNHIARFSSWSTVLRAISRLRRLARKDKTPGPVTVEERKCTELFILKETQDQFYSNEMQALKTSGKLAGNNPLFNLDPFLQDGLIRVGGRLKKASLCEDEKHPVILPKDSHVTKLIISYCHERNQHQGRGATLNELRSSGYWVVGGSKAVATHIYRCIQCRKKRKPVEEQKMADLPEDRLEASPPFTFSGMDCFGPFITKQGRKEHKRYGLLFTCMCSRAVHIEMLDDLTTDAFINGLRCFIALRGMVRQIRSDQGSNFVGAKNELAKALKEINTERLQMYLAEKQCEFVMNAPQSSHAGGIWERQIRTIRSVLTSLFQQCPGRLDDASLRTFFYEAMYIVNSRPLTVENLNDPRSPAPLTPNHLLSLKSTTALPPPGNFVKEDLYLKKRWRRIQFLTQQFWSRWRREYLQNIMNRQRWHKPRRNLESGDIVIVKDVDTPRNEWPLARVIEATADSDGLVRKVKLCLSQQNLDKKGKRTMQSSVVERPVQKLVLLLES